MFKRKPIIIPKAFVRDFPLILCQVWGGRYKEFFGKKIKTFPRYIFLIEGGLAKAYRNENPLDKELRKIFEDKMAEKQKFLKIFSEKHLRQIPVLEKFYANPHPTRKDLLVFTEVLGDFWLLIYASLFIPNDMSYSEPERNFMIGIRRKIDKVEYDAFHSIETALRKIYPELGELSSFISLNEIRKNLIPTKSQLKVRKKKTLVLNGDELITVNDLKKLEKKFNFILEGEQNLSEIDHFTGQVAYRGKARGVVKIILKNKDIFKIKSGEILVSSMTTPDFISAMRKAAAFVTDEGGITCHAAIVARELKKPCIIGTKIATKVLHDGDLVEVDADNGVVKILKKKINSGFPPSWE